MRSIYDSNWLLATPGSPISKILIFPTQRESTLKLSTCIRQQMEHKLLSATSGPHRNWLLPQTSFTSIHSHFHTHSHYLPLTGYNGKQNTLSALSLLSLTSPLTQLTSDLHAMRGAVDSSHQQQQESFFHIFMTIDLWSQGTG